MMNPVCIDSLEGKTQRVEARVTIARELPPSHTPRENYKGSTESYWEYRQFSHFTSVVHLKVSFEIAIGKTPSHLPLFSFSWSHQLQRISSV